MLSLDATAKSHDRGLVVVGGSYPSVGLAGCYTQGDGVGPPTLHVMALQQTKYWAGNP
jgi:hypothetical protein